MDPIHHIKAFESELVRLRHDFHANPETGFNEFRTAGIVAKLLKEWGFSVREGIGGTGVVGELDGRAPGRRIGLRADMDALPMTEATGLPYASKTEGVFHGCGHDGHTATLLGAARYLAQTRAFDGTAVVIFQPAEEGLGGARRMLAEGLFEKHPCDEIYGFHNFPSGNPGQIGVREGVMLAGADFFDIDIRGRGAHAAMPNLSADPVPAALAVAAALQTVVSRNADPLDSLVISITKLQSGTAYNVIPSVASLSGTIRTFTRATRALVARRIDEICAGVSGTYDVAIEARIQDIFSVLTNGKEQSSFVVEAAAELFGRDRLCEAPQMMGSEDFSDMLAAVPGCYFHIGGRYSVPLHNPEYVFDDETIVPGAALLARLVERRG